MSIELIKAMQISADGMKAQATRMRVVTENIANAQSTAQTPEELPYRRRMVTFRNVLDREMNAQRVVVNDIRPDTSEFQRRYQPGHPSADEDGYVLYPNVNSVIEMADIREAQRSYEANRNIMESVKTAQMGTIDLLRA